MATEHHPTPLSGGEHVARQSAGDGRLLPAQSAEARARGEALIRTADKKAGTSGCGPIDPSPTIEGRERRLPLAGGPVLPPQEAERFRHGRDQASADDLWALPERLANIRS